MCFWNASFISIFLFVGTHFRIFVRKFLVHLRTVYASQKLARPLISLSIVVIEGQLAFWWPAVEVKLYNSVSWFNWSSLNSSETKQVVQNCWTVQASPSHFGSVISIRRIISIIYRFQDHFTFYPMKWILALSLIRLDNCLPSLYILDNFDWTVTLWSWVGTRLNTGLS